MLWKNRAFYQNNNKKREKKERKMKEKKLGFKYFPLPFIIIKSITTMVGGFFFPPIKTELNIATFRAKC